MQSLSVNGKVLDFHYKKLLPDFYAFYVGEYYIGQVINMQGHWAAVSSKPFAFMPVSGFVTRSAASEFLLKLIDYKPS